MRVRNCIIVFHQSERSIRERNFHAQSAPLAARNSGTSFLVGFAFALRFPLVPLLLAGGHGELAFDAAVAEVEPNRDERRALSLSGGIEFLDLTAMQQQLPGAQ